MEHKIFGYVRISTDDQNEGRQIEKMKELGIMERDIIIDKKTGTNMDRENYQMLKHHLVRSGDTIVFDSLTRLGRNMENTLEEYKFFENNKINLKFIEEPYINLIHTDDHTTNDIIQVAIKKSTLTVLSAFAQKEREDTHKRQAEGIALARKNGKHLGRPSIPITDDFIKSYNRWKAGEITAVRAMAECNIKKDTFYKLTKQYQQELTK
ncbi:recombinase family protein [Bacillus sp. 1663tsa1]|uniref:recombinase family protein n=1 Tax=Bacillus sp. 1663tsa1 TaxID=2953804 RepID=UPI00209CA0FB|nr:recombinase family protein [Bacillus sp. 1663tsa1]MCP1181174.1 recombinase family protein [Bacillus sp. 1663tsa1]